MHKSLWKSIKIAENWADNEIKDSEPENKKKDDIFLGK